MKIFVTAVGHSNVGTRRENNEDNFNISGITVDSAIDKKAYLQKSNSAVITLCDGMGGEAAGEVASQTAVTEIEKHKIRIIRDFNEKAIKEAIDYANDKVCEKMYELKKYIGTTLVMIAFKKSTALIANVGDSRAYLFRNQELKQLSVDDTEAQRMVNSGIISANDAMSIPEKHRLTQNIGIPSDEMLIEPNFYHLLIRHNDKILLCSDGLTDMVSESEIADIMSKMQSAEDCADELVKTAIENGGKDNVTVIVLDFKKQFISDSICKLLK